MQVPEESLDTKSLDHVIVSYCGDLELLLLERPLGAQGLATEEMAEHTPGGPAIREVYAYMDWVDRYITNMDMHWDTTYKLS